MTTLDASYLLLAPRDIHLTVDKDFISFVKHHLYGQAVTRNQEVSITILGTPMWFHVKLCVPNPAVVGDTTHLEILPRNPQSEMTLMDARITLFMLDDHVKHLLSRLILTYAITEENALQLWHDFKKNQVKLI